MVRVLSLGGGTQSCALALMSAAGDLPRVDHVIFADTQGELPETYDYLDYLSTVLERAEIPLHVVTAGSLYDLTMAVDSESSVPARLPLHVDNGDKPAGRIPYTCSHDFKRKLIERKIKTLCGGRGAWKQSTVIQWIGFSLDELGRMKQTRECRCGHNLSAGRGNNLVPIHTGEGCTRCDCANFDPWLVNEWPLIDLRMKRDDTIRWFTENGHPTPPRSACWFCPNSGNARWQELRATRPDLFERACQLDDHHRSGGFGRNPIKGTPYFHRSLTALRDADLRTARQITADSGQGELFDDDVLAMDCTSGVCFT